jgi:hypothetical protein
MFYLPHFYRQWLTDEGIEEQIPENLVRLLSEIKVANLDI